MVGGLGILGKFADDAIVISSLECQNTAVCKYIVRMYQTRVFDALG